MESGIALLVYSGQPQQKTSWHSKRGRPFYTRDAYCNFQPGFAIFHYRSDRDLHVNYHRVRGNSSTQNPSKPAAGHNGKGCSKKADNPRRNNAYHKPLSPSYSGTTCPKHATASGWASRKSLCFLRRSGGIMSSEENEHTYFPRARESASFSVATTP